jgi:ABC-type antimicrobial peptide transport system permease subunit
MDQQISGALVTERLLAVLSVSFAVLALALACVGLYGVMAYDVARRVREIGIRIALGATRAHVIGQTLRPASVVTIAGIGAGLPIAIGLSGILTDVLFGLTATDFTTLIAAIGIVAATALVAGYLPARRAAAVDAGITLKVE